MYGTLCVCYESTFAYSVYIQIEHTSWLFMRISFFFLFQASATLSRKMPGEGDACRNSVVESKLR